jgi:hypothetical protein
MPAILIRIDCGDSVAALKNARDIAAKARGGSEFCQLARSFQDASNARASDLGWFAHGRMVKEFEEAAFKAKTGQVVGPVKTTFGYHVIKVHGRDKREAKIADIRMKVETSLATRNELSQKAEDFAYLAKQGDFAKEAEQSKYNVQETPPFQKNGAIGGIGLHVAANKFAFNNKAGAVSDVMTVPNGNAVFMVSEVKEAGTRPFEELKASPRAGPRGKGREGGDRRGCGPPWMAAARQSWSSGGDASCPHVHIHPGRQAAVIGATLSSPAPSRRPARGRNLQADRDFPSSHQAHVTRRMTPAYRRQRIFSRSSLRTAGAFRRVDRPPEEVSRDHRQPGHVLSPRTLAALSPHAHRSYHPGALHRRSKASHGQPRLLGSLTSSNCSNPAASMVLRAVSRDRQHLRGGLSSGTGWRSTVP